MIHKLNNNFFAVSILPESYWHQIVHISAGMDVFQYYMKDGEKDVSMGLDLPKGTWEFVCTSKNITEKIAKDIGAELCNENDKEIYGIKLGQPVYEHIAGSPIETIIKLLRSLNLTGDIAIIKKDDL